MRHYQAPILLAAILATSQLTSCTDDNYDLSDIDTTTRVQVNDLVIPVNLSEIKLSSIIKTEPDGIVQIVNKQYCIVKQGDFESPDIQIDPVTMKCNDIKSTTKWIDVTPFPGGTVPSGIELPPFPLSSTPSRFDVNAANVTDCITDIVEIGTDLNVTFTLSLKGFGDNKLKGFKIRNLTLQLPKYLKDVNEHGNGRYEEETGKFYINDLDVIGESKNITISFGRINFNSKTGITFNPTDHAISFHGELGVDSGEAIVNTSDIDRNNIPSRVEYLVDYKIDDIHIKSFTGGIDYKLDKFEMPRVDLSDLQDDLSQPGTGTNIELVNPQIYLTLHNPLADNNVKGTFGLDIIAERTDQDDLHFPMDAPLDIPAVTDIQYVLSPLKDFPRPQGYENAVHQPYTLLGKIISGNGLPNALAFNPTKTDINTDHVKDIRIGEPVGKFTGSYYLLAPLQFAEGSRIAYSSTSKGWSDDSEDLENLTVENLSVKAIVTNKVPIGMEIKIYPLDKNGNVIDGVEVSKVTIPAGVENYDFELSVKGSMTGLDGIQYTAVAAPGENADALTNEMTISIKQLRPKVSGYYTTDF